jgi:hypothetical protein
LGRWVSPDPVGVIDGINTFSYVHNEPLGNLDPTGYADIDLGLYEIIEHMPEAFPSFESNVDQLEAIDNAIQDADEIRFHWDKIEKEHLFDQFSQLQTYLEGFGREDLDEFLANNKMWTAYELYSILKNPEYREKTTFYKKGREWGKGEELANKLTESFLTPKVKVSPDPKGNVQIFPVVPPDPTHGIESKPIAAPDPTHGIESKPIAAPDPNNAVVKSSNEPLPSGWRIPAYIVGGAVVAVALGVVTGVLVADDVTLIGIADDPLAVITGAGAAWGGNLFLLGTAAAF